MGRGEAGEARRNEVSVLAVDLWGLFSRHRMTPDFGVV